jgi:hypothetical protein
MCVYAFSKERWLSLFRLHDDHFRYSATGWVLRLQVWQLREYAKGERERSKKKKIFAFSYCCICFLYRVRVFATKRETKISTMKFVNAYNRKRNLYIYWLFLHLDRMSLLLTFILSMGIQCRKFWELFVATIVSSYWWWWLSV